MDRIFKHCDIRFQKSTLILHQGLGLPNPQTANKQNEYTCSIRTESVTLWFLRNSESLKYSVTKKARRTSFFSIACMFVVVHNLLLHNRALLNNHAQISWCCRLLSAESIKTAGLDEHRRVDSHCSSRTSADGGVQQHGVHFPLIIPCISSPTSRCELVTNRTGSRAVRVISWGTKLADDMAFQRFPTFFFFCSVLVCWCSKGYGANFRTFLSSLNWVRYTNTHTDIETLKAASNISRQMLFKFGKTKWKGVFLDVPNNVEKSCSDEVDTVSAVAVTFCNCFALLCHVFFNSGRKFNLQYQNLEK